MSPADRAQLLKLPAGERAELAIALWESLTEEERSAEFEFGSEERAELDRRWAEHLAAPELAVLWQDVEGKLRKGT
jgi:putative addiction module component (TIGR02574 family)